MNYSTYRGGDKCISLPCVVLHGSDSGSGTCLFSWSYCRWYQANWKRFSVGWISLVHLMPRMLRMAEKELFEITKGDHVAKGRETERANGSCLFNGPLHMAVPIRPTRVDERLIDFRIKRSTFKGAQRGVSSSYAIIYNRTKNIQLVLLFDRWNLSSSANFYSIAIRTQWQQVKELLHCTGVCVEVCRTCLWSPLSEV